MKEITRIHIAKVSYEAEIEAKRELESYLKTLEAYSEDADILDDVEVRMTEILADRGVKARGVITMKDVEALEEQLGEPRDFMGDGDIAVGPDDGEKASADTSKKLFRDIDRAVLGGVLSGIAAFFKVSPALVRILFIIIALASFGTALLVYIVLWIAVPAAKTAADKLQMAGTPVTLASIRKINESEEGMKRGDTRQSRRVLLTILGIFSVIGALGAAALTIFVVTIALLGQYGNYIEMREGAGFFIAAFILAVVSGFLLTALFILGAYASFAMRATKRVVISMAVIVVVGLASFGTTIGLAQYASLRYSDAIKAAHETPLTMPGGSDKITGFIVDTPNIHVQYIVTKEAPKAVMRTIGNRDPRAVQLVLDGTTLKLTGVQHKQNSCNVFWCDGPFVTIYGPALNQLTSGKKTNVDYSGAGQANMAVTANEGADIAFSAGTIDFLTLVAKSGTDINLRDIAVSNADVTVSSGANLEFGTVAAFTVHAPASCPAGGKTRLELEGIGSNHFILNDQQVESRSMVGACVDIDIESEKV